MSNRWLILFILFFVRMTMSFQFQSVAALSPLLAESYGVSIADIGLLIGLYLVPGVAVAIPGGAIAGRFGDKRIVGLSLCLMLVGGAMVGWGPGWNWLIAGRVLSGAGGVVINIVMTKMLMDWFVGREISTAMGIFINSWPVGIALSLVTIPRLASLGGLDLAWAAVMAVIALGLVLFVLFYHAPENAAARATTIAVTRLPYQALFLAAAVWALYNAAFAMVFSFGPAFLSQRGWDLTSASSATSIFIVVTAIAVPLGGMLADWTRRRDTVIVVSLLGYAVLMPLALLVADWALPVVFVAAAALFGLGAGPIVGLPSAILTPQSRAFGTGVYYTLYYALMMAAPTLGGLVAERSGSIGATIILGSFLLLLAILSLGLFRRASVEAIAQAGVSAAK